MDLHYLHRSKHIVQCFVVLLLVGSKDRQVVERNTKQECIGVGALEVRDAVLEHGAGLLHLLVLNQHIAGRVDEVQGQVIDHLRPHMLLHAHQHLMIIRQISHHLIWLMLYLPHQHPPCLLTQPLQLLTRHFTNPLDLSMCQNFLEHLPTYLLFPFLSLFQHLLIIILYP